VFLSFATTGDQSRAALITGQDLTLDFSPDLYAEIGLGRGLTLALSSSGMGQTRMTEAALRYTLSDPGDTWQAALDLGLMHDPLPGEDRAHQYLRLGASIGRGLGPGGPYPGLPLRHDGGWTTVEAQAYLDAATADLGWKAAGTLGLAFDDRWRAMLTATAEDWPGAEPAMWLDPSILLSVGASSTLRLGTRIQVDGGDRLGLVLGVWHEF
jgi:hypothetical protein